MPNRTPSGRSGAAPSVLRAAALLCALASGPILRAVPLTNQSCLDCHELVPPEKRDKDAESNPAIEILRPDRFAKSVHGKLLCVDCHAGITGIPHDDKLPPAQCASCHEKEAGAYAKSIHGMSHAMGASGAATCASCHGDHEIAPVKHADSPVFKLNLPQTCARCHSNDRLTSEYRIGSPQAPANYADSIRGQAHRKMGLSVAQSSPTNKANIADTCGQCHVGIEAIYSQSVHGVLLARGDRRGPVCSDCHSAHQISAPSGVNFKAQSDLVCGRCHQDRLARYRDTYHGKAMALGRPNVASDVAACYDCHGHHDVFPVSDPRSRLSRGHIVDTCRQCHPGVSAKFTEYRPHADPLDRANYPLLHRVYVGMTALLIGVFSLFGLHTLLWLVRSVYLYLNDTKTFREAKVQATADDVQFTRFTPFDRLLHLMVVTSFLLLVLTGMPLKFYYTNWAKVIFGLIGGADVARALHHFGALVTFAYFGLHLAALVTGLWTKRRLIRNPETGRLEARRVWTALFGPDSMVPSAQDFRDFVAHQKWFF